MCLNPPFIDLYLSTCVQADWHDKVVYVGFYLPTFGHHWASKFSPLIAQSVYIFSYLPSSAIYSPLLICLPSGRLTWQRRTCSFWYTNVWTKLFRILKLLVTLWVIRTQITLIPRVQFSRHFIVCQKTCNMVVQNLVFISCQILSRLKYLRLAWANHTLRGLERNKFLLGKQWSENGNDAETLIENKLTFCLNDLDLLH